MECPASPWYSDRRFSSFWQHYNMVMSAAHQDAVGRAKHVVAQTKVALTGLQSGVYQHPREQLQQPSKMSGNPYREKYRKSNCKRQQKSNRRNRRHKLRRNVQGNQSDTESLYSKMRQGMHIQDVNEDMEVTEDFLIFLEQSKKHREEWKVAKFQDKLNTTQKTTLDTEKMVPDAEAKEHPDVTRSREMQQLYGQASPKLQAMETALQLSFDRNATLYQPQYWPNIPLNVMFDRNYDESAV